MMLGIIREKVSNNWYILHINPLFLSFNDNLSETSEYILNLLQPKKIKGIIINCAKLDRLTELHIVGFLSLIKKSKNLNKKISLLVYCHRNITHGNNVGPDFGNNFIHCFRVDQLAKE